MVTRVSLLHRLPLFIHRSAFGARHLTRHIAHKLLQRRHSGRIKVRPCNANVGIEICHCMGQFLRVHLDPLGRAHQALFFGIPARNHDATLGLPSLLQQVAQPMHSLEHRSGAAIQIDRPIDPRVAMISGNDPIFLLLRICAIDCADHIPDGAQLVVLHQVHVNLHCARPAEMVGEGQCALPLARSLQPIQRLKNRRRILIRQGIRRNRRLIHLGWIGDALRVRQVGRRRNPWRLWITWIDWQKLHAAALHTRRRAIRPARIHIATSVAVVRRVGINQNTRCAILLRDIDLYAAEVGAVTHNHNLALDTDSQRGELLEVLECAVVCVHNIGGDIA